MWGVVDVIKKKPELKIKFLTKEEQLNIAKDLKVCQEPDLIE
jgi:hypothetical protein